LAVSLDLDAYDRQREAMLTLLEVAAGAAPFSAWIRQSESAAVRQERLEVLLTVLYGLLRDVLVLSRDREDRFALRNADIRPRLESLAARVDFPWLRRAVDRVDELASLVRRNIQKNLALDALIAELLPA
jgi:DNA polymerase-3 subunit delta'